jgi:FkbM family methyltransferase
MHKVQGDLPSMQCAAMILIDKLIQNGPSSAVNWEGLLAHQYKGLLRHPRLIIDVGAHVGAHAWTFLSLHPRKVECFEPIPYLASALETNLKGQAAKVHAIALSDEDGQSIFVLNVTMPSESGLKQREYSSSGKQELDAITVATSRLDRFEFQEVDFIKIDCEGAEIKVLRGASETIANNRPFMSVEYGRAGYSAYGLEKNALLEWAMQNDYVISDLFGNAMNDPQCYDYCVDKYYYDFLLIPAEQWSSKSAVLCAGAVTSGVLPGEVARAQK